MAARNEEPGGRSPLEFDTETLEILAFEVTSSDAPMLPGLLA